MVNNVTSMTRNGLRDFLIQRLSAVVIACYLIFLMLFFILHPHLEHVQWLSLFQNSWMRVSSLIFLMALLAHAWVGVWTISTDYIKFTAWRLLFQACVIFVLLASLIWGIQILWEV